MKRTWTTQHAIRLLAAAPIAWWLGATWGVPWIIRAAHADRIPLLGRFMGGRADRPLEGYLAAWEPLGRASVVVVLTTALIAIGALLVVRHERSRASGAAGPDSPAATDGQLLLIAAWVGVITGLGEAYYILIRAFYAGAVIPDLWIASQHVVWMAPLTDLVSFALLGLVLILVSRMVRGQLASRTLVVLLVWLGMFSLVMATDRLHWAGACLLTLGVAVQVGRVLSRGAGEFALLARRSMGWLVPLIVALGLGVRGLEIARERGQLADAGADVPQAPNVLFIVLDTERAASTTLHGGARPTTPFLNEFAARGVTFEWALSAASWTLPSHAAMFTGHRAVEFGLTWNSPFADSLPTLAEQLSQRGYATAGFVANPAYLSDFFGLDRGFGRWEDQPVLPGTIISHAWLARTVSTALREWLGNHQILGRKTAQAVNHDFLSWLEGREARPYFAFLNYFDAHAPYLPPEPWNLTFSSSQPLYWFRDLDSAGAYSERERAELRTAYEASIAYLDNQLRDLFAALDARGQLANSIVVITSDHGEAFGENGQMGHGLDLVMPLIHVPLVLVYPRKIPAGLRISRPVGLRHVATTILSMAVGDGDALAGESLERYWQYPVASAAGAVSFARNDGIASIVTEAWHFLQDGQGRERLFAYREDPLELEDLSRAPELAATMDSLRLTLASLLAANP